MESLNMRYRNRDFNQGNFAPCHIYQIDSRKAITTIKHRMAVQKVLNLIGKRLHDPPTLGELAHSAGLSRSYFSPVFKEVAGMRLQDYLFQARINKAKDLLSDISLPIKQIAYEVGFRDPDHFSRTFKIKTGMTPTNWRIWKFENSPSKGSKQNKEKQDWRKPNQTPGHPNLAITDEIKPKSKKGGK